MKFWDKKNECLSRDEISHIQLERLQATLNRVYKNVSYYKKTFREIDFMPEDLRSLTDFKKLPFVSRSDLRDNYPYNMFAVPLREVVRLHAPARSVDKPVVVGFTANDLKVWAQLMARGLTGVGVDKDDVVQVSLVPGKLIGPFGMHMGTELIGASVIPMSVGKLTHQAKIMRDFRVTTLVTTPGFALELVRSMESMGIQPMDLTLKYGVLGSEPWSETAREELEEKLHISVTDTYGLAEVFGPGVAWECPVKEGLHISEDHFIPEIINPVTRKPVGHSEEGELVLTTITKEAFPLIRFRTGDIARLIDEPCPCGRTHRRISRIFKRCDDIIVMKGVSITPEDIGRIISNVHPSEMKYQIVLDRQNDQDQLMILVEISDRIFFDEMKKQGRFVESLRSAVSEFLGWEVTIKLVEPGTVVQGNRVIDNRKFQQ